MHSYPADIFTEPEPDVDAREPGPLDAPAGIWSARGFDVNPSATVPRSRTTSKRWRAAADDAQTNGPQRRSYGLRYHNNTHTRIVKPGRPETFHDQVGLLLEMATVPSPRSRSPRAGWRCTRHGGAGR